MSAAGGNSPVARAEVRELCDRLGHDPARVSRIIIEPDVITVEYTHLVAENNGERP